MKQHSSYWAFMVHRVSGIALAAFLPLHFWTLASALQHSLAWTQQPLVKLGEWAIVLQTRRRNSDWSGAALFSGLA